MSDREEWTPWIDHDGKGCPLKVGQTVHAIEADGDQWISTIGQSFFDPDEDHEVNVWVWESAISKGFPDWRVIRYRIRKPRALQQLREMIETLPAPSRQKEDTHV